MHLSLVFNLFTPFSESFSSTDQSENVPPLTAPVTTPSSRSILQVHLLLIHVCTVLSISHSLPVGAWGFSGGPISASCITALHAESLWGLYGGKESNQRLVSHPQLSLPSVSGLIRDLSPLSLCTPAPPASITFGCLSWGIIWGKETASSTGQTRV